MKMNFIVGRAVKKESLLGRTIRLFLCSLFLIGVSVSCSKSKNSSDQLTLFRKATENIDSVSVDSLNRRVTSIIDDSLKQRLYFNYTYHYLRKKDSSSFQYWNNKAYLFSQLNRDSTSIGEAVWDRGSFNYSVNKFDSAFYYYKKAANIYKQLGDFKRSGKLILSAAIAQRNAKDYYGSEVTTIEAIKDYKKIEYNEGLYNSYNNLGILHNNLNNYESALRFHENALTYISANDNRDKISSTQNNIGVVYQNLDNHELALDYFQRAIKNDEIEGNNPRLYAMLLDNIAYSKLKLGESDFISLKEQLDKSKTIRKKIKHDAGLSVSNIHLASLYITFGDTLKANQILKDQLTFSRETSNKRDELKTLGLLSSVNPGSSEQFLKKYIDLSEKLIKEERDVRNKYARIEFETDTVIDKNNKLIAQKNIILYSSIFLISVLSLIFMVFYLSYRNKKLNLQRKQDLANQEIYEILMDQQAKIEEGRRHEKNRISRELHDGILGELYGLRFLLYSNNQNDSDHQSNRSKYLNEMRGLEDQIRALSHDLSFNNEGIDNSFIKLLEDFIQERNEISSTSFHLEIDRDIDFETIYSNVKINLFRIIQESVQNVIKHSEANRCRIKFLKRNNHFTLSIKDNGIGFNHSRVKDGIGLSNIKSRVKDLNGKIKIFSGENGTLIVILIDKNKF